MRVRFWGTRGSIAKAGPGTVRYGGNTSCVEVRSGGGTLVVLDCGTGAHGLGHALVTAGPAPRRGHLLITHTHWDHIQGIPFFQPLFAAGDEWDIYAPGGLGQSIRETLAGQMQYSYFPVRLEDLGATIRYHELVEGVFGIDDILVTTRYLNHPALTLGYRLEADGVAIVYATDHEPHARDLAAGAEREHLGGEDQRHAAFLAGADLVIHDAQYTASEYPAKVGWGHSTMEYVVDVARASDVRRLALFHHDPLRDDDAMDRLVEAARRRVARSLPALEVFAAAEGQVVELIGVAPGRVESAGAQVSTAMNAPPTMVEYAVVLASGDPQTTAALSDAAQSDGFRLLVAADGDAALRFVRSDRPSLLVLERQLPDRDGLDVCGAVRAEAGTYGQEVPVVITTTDDRVDMWAGGKAGVTDWLVKPFSSLYARARIRAWVLRTVCRWQRAPLPKDEARRLQALRRLGLLDTEPEERFDRLTRLAATLFDAPIALVGLIDADRQWFKSTHGLDAREVPREVSFCAHAIHGNDVMVVPDATLDPRFADNPGVTGGPRIRAYVGYPLAVADGSRVGTLCILDPRPRQLDGAALQLFRDLGALVEQELNRTRPAV
ncbi:MAG TPA: GAF domain-containing protein [Methylomirabilota bacterium]|jgi:phosphoribosyl 1,2-cyclic phosphodiesterase/CheY-like chemotaxis protein|nr:GAF domain-containing protein [Methylomirabilota bacterium]